MKIDTEINKAFLDALRARIPSNLIFCDPAERQAYSYDNSRYQSLPDLVVLPENHEQVVAVIKTCYEFGVPVTTRGRGTNTTGAAVPIQGGLVLSLERMDQILSIDPGNRMIRAAAGTLNQSIQDYVKNYGFFWPPDPSSAGYSTIGGNLACNAGGPRALKFGACRENTLALKAVTGTGETITTGFYTTKYAVAYDLSRLLIGSEGTLAVITEAALKLQPLPENIFTFSAFFASATACTTAITRLMQQPYTPWTLEYIDGEGLRRIHQCSELQIPKGAEGFLIIEIDGASEIFTKLQNMILSAIKSPELLQFQSAATENEAKELWHVRKRLSPSLRQIAPTKMNEDIVIPVSQMSAFIQAIEPLRLNTEIIMVIFGHAGNGNLHVNLLYEGDNPKQQAEAETKMEFIFKLAIQLGGTLSGEHGIGLDKKKFMPWVFDQSTLNCLRAIKQVFDPKGILNPGKVLP